MSLFQEEKDKSSVTAGPVYKIDEASKNPDFLEYVQNQRGFMEKLSERVNKTKRFAFSYLYRFVLKVKPFLSERKFYIKNLQVDPVIVVLLPCFILVASFMVMGALGEPGMSTVKIENGFPSVKRVELWWPGRQVVWMGNGFGEQEEFSIPVQTSEGPRFVVVNAYIELFDPIKVSVLTIYRRDVIHKVQQQLRSILQNEKDIDKWFQGESTINNEALEDMHWGPNNAYKIDVKGEINFYMYRPE